MQKIYLIHTAVASLAEATHLANALVEQHRCACVQIAGPGLSIYRWKGKLEQANEYYLSIKTNRLNRECVVTWLEQHHPYDLPEITWQRHGASDAYVEWVEQESRK